MDFLEIGVSVWVKAIEKQVFNRIIDDGEDEDCKPDAVRGPDRVSMVNGCERLHDASLNRASQTG